jgi:hypothetical protein
LEVNVYILITVKELEQPEAKHLYSHLIQKSVENLTLYNEKKFEFSDIYETDKETKKKVEISVEEEKSEEFKEDEQVEIEIEKNYSSIDTEINSEEEVEVEEIEEQEDKNRNSFELNNSSLNTESEILQTNDNYNHLETSKENLFSIIKNQACKFTFFGPPQFFKSK